MRTIAILCAVFTLVPRAHGDIVLHALRATVRIDGGGQSGTAFVVGLPPADGTADRRVLVTAAHALENMKGNTCTVSFRESRAEGFVRHDARAEIRAAGMPRWVRHPQADVAVLPIDVPGQADVEPFPIGQLADAAAFARGEVVVGQGVTVACFPAKTEANAAGWPILRRGTVATHPLTPVDQLPTFFVDYAHFGGDSGSAVVVDRGGRALVAGIVVAMQRQTDRVTSPFEEKKVHTPLGLAIAVPADRILETIDRWERGTGRQPPAAN